MEPSHSDLIVTPKVHSWKNSSITKKQQIGSSQFTSKVIKAQSQWEKLPQNMLETDMEEFNG